MESARRDAPGAAQAGWFEKPSAAHGRRRPPERCVVPQSRNEHRHHHRRMRNERQRCPISAHRRASTTHVGYHRAWSNVDLCTTTIALLAHARVRDTRAGGHCPASVRVGDTVAATHREERTGAGVADGAYAAAAGVAAADAEAVVVRAAVFERAAVEVATATKLGARRGLGAALDARGIHAEARTRAARLSGRTVGVTPASDGA